MLTRCRKGEVLTLRWSDYREGHLFLRGSKTGPRTVCLSQAACHVLKRIPRTSAWAFPARRADRETGIGLPPSGAVSAKRRGSRTFASTTSGTLVQQRLFSRRFPAPRGAMYRCYRIVIALVFRSFPNSASLA